MLPLDVLPSGIKRCIHYFTFTIAVIILVLGILMMQRKKNSVGEYIIVTGVLVLMIAILLLSNEFRGRGDHSLATLAMSTTSSSSSSSPPLNDPPPLYNDAWGESYLQDQKKRTESDPPPPAYRESWSRGLFRKYFQNGRKSSANQLSELNASTLSRDVENATLFGKANNVSLVPSGQSENTLFPQLTTVIVSPVGETSHASSTPDLERRRATVATVFVSNIAERLRQRSCSVAQLPSLIEISPPQSPLLPTTSRDDDKQSLIGPSHFEYISEGSRKWMIKN